MSLDPVSFCLEELLEQDVMFSNNCISEDAIGLSDQMKPGEIHLLENLRFYKGETENNLEFSKLLARHGEIYINDAFGSSHRSHASNVGVPNLMSETGIGLLMEKEINYLSNMTNNPIEPCVLILGGAKVEGKIDLINYMMDKVDAIFIGGAMAFTFLKANGVDIGASLVDNGKLKMASELLSISKKNNINIILPMDFVVAKDMKWDTKWRIASTLDFKQDEAGYDIGPETTMNYEMLLSNMQTILWNGPMGVCEIPIFSTGTQAIAAAIKNRTEDGAISIIGGGDTASALNNTGMKDCFTHISTGGGASLQLMSGKELPAIKALQTYA
jgi:3-phosphoglycerate kinase